MNTIPPREDTSYPSAFNKAITEFLSAGTSVTAYHPFKTMGQQIFKGSNLDLSPTTLYRGFSGSALGAHQLFLMGALYGFLKEHFENPSPFQKMGLGGLAGALTTFTVTPCEMMSIQKQNQMPLLINTLSRGWQALLGRQVGLGIGMLECPGLLQEKFKALFPNFAKEHAWTVKVGCSLTVGAVTAAMTQIFEQARIMMQNDPRGEKYKDAMAALQKAPLEMMSSKGTSLFAIRLATLAVATLAFSIARETYPKMIFNKENRS